MGDSQLPAGESVKPASGTGGTGAPLDLGLEEPSDSGLVMESTHSRHRSRGKGAVRVC